MKGWGVRIRFREGRYGYDATSTGKESKAEVEANAAALRKQKPHWRVDVVPAEVKPKT